ncbi:MAG: response regulator, partial [Ignavibacteriales bacterium]|nr:response regulator [Ignavibacteriales bacterium]
MAEKILVVDDEDIIRESISYVLSNEGYEVEQAENGRVAYEKALETTYDLIITDIEMPQMKGTELLEKVSAVTSSTSFIVITAYGSLDTAIKALRAGAHDYILKPVEFDELSIKLRRLFDADPHRAERYTLDVADLHVDLSKNLLTDEIRDAL